MYVIYLHICTCCIRNWFHSLLLSAWIIDLHGKCQDECFQVPVRSPASHFWPDSNLATGSKLFRPWNHEWSLPHVTFISPVHAANAETPVSQAKCLLRVTTYNCIKMLPHDPPIRDFTSWNLDQFLLSIWMHLRWCHVLCQLHLAHLYPSTLLPDGLLGPG